MKKVLVFGIMLVFMSLMSCSNDPTRATSNGKTFSFPAAGAPNHWVDANGNVQMDPPPPGQGIQIRVVPFSVPSGTEVQGVFFFDLPSDVDFSIGRIEIAMNEGTHHMNCFLTPYTQPDSNDVPKAMVMRKDDGTVAKETVHYVSTFYSSFMWASSDMMIEAQVPYLNWVLPITPEGKQTYVKLTARRHMLIETHFVNKGLTGGASQLTPNDSGAVIINLWKLNTTLPSVPASMMVAKKTNINIPPHQDVTFSKNCMFFPNDLDSVIYLLGATGHFHSRGKMFRIDKMRDSIDNNGNLVSSSVVQYGIYQNSNWNEPPFKGFDPPIKINRAQHEYIRYVTEYVNNSDQTFLFGPHVDYEEHCNLFTWFVPAWHDGQTLYDNQSN